MDNSILNSIKNNAGVNSDDSVFDGEIILHTNSAFMKLRQLGVGPETPFSIEDDGPEWTDFTEDESILPMVKSYVTLYVRLLFDPPTSSALETAMKEQLSEYEWRLNVEADTYKVEEDKKYASYFSDSNKQ